MFRRDIIGGGGILYIKEYIQAYEIKLEREADIVTVNTILTIGLVY